ncbi:unannotated protein [freshwater metagenome]|uniref:Unannotated protein n=1 Tax=freshwater metagenome TaxID=449393 RepID=A0A6J6B1B6_9ZZZZ
MEHWLVLVDTRLADGVDQYAQHGHHADNQHQSAEHIDDQGDSDRRRPCPYLY